MSKMQSVYMQSVILGNGEDFAALGKIANVQDTTSEISSGESSGVRAGRINALNSGPSM